jgi:CBS domain containing-hemolysin-like protein
METWYLVLAFVFVLANGFFVAAEFAIVKVRSTQITELADQGSVRAKMAKKLIRRMDAYLSATQLGITLASLALGWIGEPAFHHLIQPLFTRFQVSEAYAKSISASVAFVIISILHIVLGELAPKSVAIQKPVATTLWTAHLLHAFYVITYPAIWMLNGISRQILRLFGIHPASEHSEIAHSPEELRLILASSEKAGILSEENREIIEGVFQFSKRTARQIMVPRTDVVFLSTTRSIGENLETIRTTRHTRYPLCAACAVAGTGNHPDRVEARSAVRAREQHGGIRVVAVHREQDAHGRRAR